MTGPMDRLMDAVAWKEVAHTPTTTGERYCTHEGVLTIAGISLRVYQLDNGERVLDAEDVMRLFTPPADEDE